MTHTLNPAMKIYQFTNTNGLHNQVVPNSEHILPNQLLFIKKVTNWGSKLLFVTTEEKAVAFSDIFEGLLTEEQRKLVWITTDSVVPEGAGVVLLDQLVPQPSREAIATSKIFRFHERGMNGVI